MFKPKTSDLQKSLVKLKDNKKDLRTRFKHLKLILDHNNLKESKRILCEDTEEIFKLFVENFYALDQSLKQKGQRVNKEDVDNVLYSLERILLLLPEFIRANPHQAAVITTVLKRCLHPGSALRLRRDAMRPFLIYYQILRESGHEELHHLFTVLVPGLPPVLTQDENDPTWSKRDIFESSPPLLLPPTGEKPLEQMTRLMYETLLDLLVSQVFRISWDSGEEFQISFAFLFDKFKIGYLSRIFPESRACANHGKVSEAPEGNGLRVLDPLLVSLQVVTLKWVITFFQSPEAIRPNIDALKKRPRDNSVGSESVDSFQANSVSSKLSKETSGATSGFSAAMHNFLHFEVNVPNSGGTDGKQKSAPYASNIFLMVRHTLLSSPQNVQLIHELFESAFRFPLTDASVIRRVVSVYSSWIAQAAESNRNNSVNGSVHVDNVDAVPRQATPNVMVDQTTLKLFCANSVHPFTVDIGRVDVTPALRSQLLDDQEDICKRIIALHRFAIMKIPMSLSTWECVLSTLIRVTQNLMPVEPPKDRLSVLCGRLAVPIFQTLLVAWVKGTLSAFIPPRLWDELTKVLSPLTAWDELIIRWEKTLELITRLFAAEVFGVDAEHSPDRGTLTGNSNDATLTAEQPRPSSSASCDAEGLTIQMLTGSSHSNPKSADSGSVTIDEEDQFEGDKSDTLKPELQRPTDEVVVRRRRHVSEEPNDGTLSNPDNSFDTSRSTSTPDSLRESLSSPLFYPAVEYEKKRTASACSWISVMAGGQLHGWSPDSTCALWFRVFGVIGPVNKIGNPVSHKFALESVRRIVDMLHAIHEKKNLTFNNVRMGSNVLETFVPVAIVAPLLFEATTLPSSYHASQVLALKMLCEVTFRAHPIPKNFIVHFYRVIHKALLSNDFEFIDVVYCFAGMPLFCSGISNAFILVEDFVSAAQVLTNSRQPELQLKSIRLLSSLLFYLKRLPSTFTALEPNPDLMRMQPCHIHVLEEKIYDVIVHYINVAFPSSVRIPAFHCIGNILYQLLDRQVKPSPTTERLLVPVLEAIENYAGEGASEVVNILTMLSNHAQKLFKLNPAFVVHIMEVICSVLRKIAVDICTSVDLSKEVEEVFIKLTLCLSEWVILIPEIISMECNGSGEKSVTLRWFIEKTLEEIVNISDPLVMNETDDFQTKLLTEPKVKGKRAFSDHFSSDRRSSATDVGTILASKVADEEPVLARRATVIFGRAAAEPTKEKKVPVVRSEIRTQTIFHEGRFRTLKLVGCYAARHIANMLQSVPDPKAWALPTTLVSEEDCVGVDAGASENLQMFSIYDMLISVICVTPSGDVASSESPENPLLSAFADYPRVRLIIRDVAGKYCYDIRSLFGTRKIIDALHAAAPNLSLEHSSQTGAVTVVKPVMEEESDAGAISSFDDLLKNHSEDFILDILRYVDHTSPDLGLSRDHPWTNPGLPPPGLSREREALATRIMHEQHVTELEYVNEKRNNDLLYAPKAAPPAYGLPDFVYCYCSRFLSQFGYAGTAKRQHFNLLNRTEEMFRDLKLLDRRPNRETQKIAVVYIARGQEDKMSIMTNSCGSEAYERFVNQLGWTVEVADHKGFRGGLPQGSWQFSNAVYFGSSTMEVVFHVATRVGALTSEDHTVKMRHIGNDEVQIIWSDHYQDYDRKIIPTHFGDVIICIYPAEPKGLYRIQILQRDHIPLFGPLYDGAIVDEENLAGLVRNTALNAGRACRKKIKGFQHFFEERADYLKSLIQGYTIEGTYEQFLSSIISPQRPKLDIPVAHNRDVFAYLQPTWRDSTRRYHEKVRQFRQNPDTIRMRYSFPLQSPATSSTTDV